MSSYPIITIDGPAGSGKSTAAKQLARALSYTLLDTGAIYRALALHAWRANISWQDEPALTQLAQHLGIAFRLEGDCNRVYLAGDDISEAIRTPDISNGASQVSALPEVRRALLQLQRAFADMGPLVAEGRDMGTKVFPDAPVKIFLVADPLVRAQRRYQELRMAGHSVSLDQVLRQESERDAADETRSVAPLRPASDAITLDTSQLSIDQVVDRILTLARNT